MEKHDAVMVSPSFPAQLAGTPPILTTESTKKQKMENHKKINHAQLRKGLHCLEDPEIATLDTISTPQCPPAGLRLQETVPAWPLKRRLLHISSKQNKAIPNAGFPTCIYPQNKTKQSQTLDSLRAYILKTKQSNTKRWIPYVHIPSKQNKVISNTGLHVCIYLQNKTKQLS
jgi:hypothetical protein